MGVSKKMKITKKTPINEDIENLMKGNNKNLKQPEELKKAGIDTEVHLDPVYGQAIVDEKKAEEEVAETMKEVSENSEGLTPEDPDTGKKIKNAYTESIELDEGLFEDSQTLNEAYVTAGAIANEIRDAVEWLKEEQTGCSTYKLDNRLAICTGWSDGYDPEDEHVIHDDGNGYGTWAIVAGIKVWTSDDLRTDYDFINYPYFESGDVWDTGVSISPNEDYNELADWFLKEYTEMSKYDIDEDGLIHEDSSEDDEPELTTDDMNAGQWYESCENKGNKLNEITDREIDNEHATIWRNARERTGMKNVLYKDLSADEMQRVRELSAISMINSVLAYLDRGEMGRTGVTMKDGAEAILDAELSRSHSYLKPHVDELGREKVIELIQGQIDDIDTVEKDTFWDDESGSYNSIKWKREGIKEAKQIEDLPDTVYELAYDRLFPKGVKNYKPTFLADEKISFDDDRFYVRGLEDWDIGVAVKDDKEANFVKKVADFVGGKYEYKDSGILKDGMKGIAIIHFTEDKANTPTDKYLKSIGYKGEVRNNPNKKKNESLTLSEDVKVIVGLKDYEPWSGARPWFEIIEQQGKLDELDAFLEEMYPEGIEDGELNDLIWFEPEYVFENIGIRYDFQNDRLIDDEEEEEEAEVSEED